MIEFIYSVLSAIGFNHPLHPVVTHIPMGMIIGAFIFYAASFRWDVLSKTANHCIVLAFIFLPPTVLFGYMDWQHRYTGFMSSIILMKIILALLLFVLLAVEVYLIRTDRNSRKLTAVLYTLNLITAVGLGFLGGQLIFG